MDEVQRMPGLMEVGQDLIDRGEALRAFSGAQLNNYRSSTTNANNPNNAWNVNLNDDNVNNNDKNNTKYVWPVRGGA